MAMLAEMVNVGGGQLLVIAVAGAAYGLLLVGLGQVFSALREIALNTRAARPAGQPPESGSAYVGLRFIAGVLALVGVLVTAVSLVVVFGALANK